MGWALTPLPLTLKEELGAVVAMSSACIALGFSEPRTRGALEGAKPPGRDRCLSFCKTPLLSQQSL